MGKHGAQPCTSYGNAGKKVDATTDGDGALSYEVKEAVDVQILPAGQVPAGYDGSAACVAGEGP